MSELQVIQETLRHAARRRRMERAWRGLWHGALAGVLIFFAGLAVFKLFPVPYDVVTAAAAAGAAAVVAGMMIGLCRPVSLKETARWVDDRKHLQERLSTAMEWSNSPGQGHWRDLLLADAARHAKGIRPAELLPLRLPRASRWALMVAVLCVGLGFVPEFRTERHLQALQEEEIIKEAGKQVATLTRQSLEQRGPLLEPTRETLQSVEEFGLNLEKNPLTRNDALKDLANMAEKIQEQMAGLEKDPAMQRMRERQREESRGGRSSQSELQRQMEAVQKQLGQNVARNPEELEDLRDQLRKAQEAAANLGDPNSEAGAAARERLLRTLSEMARQARDAGEPLPQLEEAIAALQQGMTDQFVKNLDLATSDLEKMADMARTLEQLQQQATEQGKDLPEQLKYGQTEAAQKSLGEMVERLKASNVDREEMEKILDEVQRAVDPASPYGKVAEHLKDAVREMRQGQRPEAAESLAAAADELEKLMQQLNDADALMASLEALRRAEMAIATRKNWAECKGGQCQACEGAGCGQCNGTGMCFSWGQGGKGGPAGVGTWADENGWSYYNPQRTGPVDNSGIQRPDMAGRGVTERDSNTPDNLAPTKIQGQLSPGGQMPSITLKGVSIKGTSTVEFQEAVTAAQTEAQSAINQDRVPRPYQGAVRDYFDDFKE